MNLMLSCIVLVDETSRQITAFKGLARVMNTAKQSTVNYFYEECKVCIL